MSEIEASHPFIVKGEDGETYAGATDAAGATVLAGAIYVAATDQQYRPSLTVVEFSTGTIVAIVGQPTPAPPPILTSLDPSTVVKGLGNTILRCLGEGFQEGAVIVVNNGDEATTFVSEEEVTTGVNADTISGTVVVPVYVRNRDGQQSAPLDLTFLAAPEVPGEETT
jgi:hypothetical protein